MPADTRDVDRNQPLPGGAAQDAVEPGHVTASAGLAIPPAPDGPNGIDDVDELDDIEELEDIEALEELEPLDDDDDGDDDVAARAAPRPSAPSMPPPTPSAPPPIPPRGARPPAPPPPVAARRLPTAGDGVSGVPVSVPAAISGGISGGFVVGLDPLADRSGPLAGSASGPVASTEPAPPPLEIATPTVLDQALAQQGDRAPAARAEALEARLAATMDEAEAAVLAYELGALCERQLGDEDRALEAYRRAMQADPSLRANLWALRGVLQRRGLWSELLEVIEAEANVARDDDERADLYIERGHVLEHRLGEPAQARDAYETATVLSPGAAGAHHGLERLALAGGDDESLMRAVEGLAACTDEPSRRLFYLLDLARMHADRGELIDAQEVLARAASLGVDLDRVTREQVRVAALTDDPQELIDALEARVVCLAGAPPDTDAGAAAAPDGDAADTIETAAAARAMVALRRRQAQIARDRLDDPESAWSYLQQALILAPGESLLLADLADLAEQLGRYDELAELCAGWESMEGDGTRSLSLSLRRADALLRGGQQAEAQALLASLARSAPGYLPITALCERDALVSQDWAVLARAYRDAGMAARRGTTFAPEGAADDADPAAAAAYLVCAGDLFDWMLDQEEDARGCYAQALEAVPGHGPAIEAMCALEERAGNLTAAAALLEARSSAGTRDERAQVLERLARIYWDLGQHEDVLGAEQRLLDLATAGQDDGAAVRVRWRIEATLADLGRTRERAALLAEQAEHLEVPARRGATLLRAARIYDEELAAGTGADEAQAAADAAQAAALYGRVLEVWPGDRYARAARLALLRRTGRWDELVAERRAEVAELADGPALARALRDAADVLCHELGRPAEAAELYRELLDRIPGHPGALRGLSDVLAELGDLEELIDILELESVTQESEAAQCDAIVRLGRALEGDGRHEDALDAYRRAADVDPRSALPAVALAELADLGDDVGARAEALDHLAAGRPDAGLRGAILEDVGWLWALEADDDIRALEALERAAAEAASPGAYLGLALLHTARGDEHEAGEALAHLAEATHAPGVESALLLRAAAVAAVEEDRAQVRARLRQAVAADADDVGTAVVAADEALGVDPDEPIAGPGELLVRAELFAMRAALAGTPAAREEWELEQAEVLEMAGRLRDAAGIAAAVLDGNPGDIRALQVLRRVCRHGGDRAGLARASLALARALSDSEGKIELLREAAGILDRELDDAAGAVPVYRRILAEDPGAPEYERVMEICRAHEDVRALVELTCNRLNWLDMLVRIDPEAARAQVPLLHERALLRHALGDARGAGRDLARLLAIEPAHAEALATRARIVEELGEAELAAELLQRFLEVETDPDRRAEAELALSRILAEDMDDVAGAIEQLEQVVQKSPDDLVVRERLVGLLTRAGQWARVVAELGEIEQRRDKPAEQARDLIRIAGVLRDRQDDRAGAEAALERAWKLDPLNLDAVRELAELLGAGAPGGSAADRRRQVLRKAAHEVRRAIGESPERTGLYERLAVIAGWQGTRETRYYALCALDILGSLSAEQERFVAETGAALAGVPLSAEALSTEEWSKRISAVRTTGAHLAADLWQVIGEAVTRTLGLEPGKLGFGRGDRVKSVDGRYEALARTAACFGVAGAEYYISASRPGYARVLSLGAPVLCLGEDIARGEGAAARFVLGRAMAQARLGTGALSELRQEEAVLLLAAAVHIAGVPAMPASLADAAAADPGGMDERVRALQKHMGRRDRRQLARLVEQMGAIEPVVWRDAALRTAARAGLLLAGDVRGPIEVLDLGRGGSKATGDRAVLDLLVWMVSEDHLWLRRHLGLTAGAT